MFLRSLSWKEKEGFILIKGLLGVGQRDAHRAKMRSSRWFLRRAHLECSSRCISKARVRQRFILFGEKETKRSIRSLCKRLRRSTWLERGSTQYGPTILEVMGMAEG